MSTRDFLLFLADFACEHKDIFVFLAVGPIFRRRPLEKVEEI